MPLLNPMLKRPYKIKPYNPEWPNMFLNIKRDIEKIFKDKALLVEHVGSTAMPGMSSKGVIDVCVVVEKMEAFLEEKNKMIKLGYKCEDGYIKPNTVFIYKEKEDLEKIINIHVLEKGDSEIDKFILERDYFLAHPERIRMYNELKLKLSKEFPEDYPSYRAGKAPFLKETLELAKAWGFKK